VADDEITVWVEDEGPGVRASRLAPLFERFVRTVELDEEGEPEQGGMGLGLAIVKSIVDRHGGRVEVRDGTIAGRATRICVILPRESGHENPGR
jgi:signal transduction histidine kinase